jgi:hypothetical protein
MDLTCRIMRFQYVWVVLYVSEIDPNFNHMVTPSGVTMTTKAWSAFQNVTCE